MAANATERNDVAIERDSPTDAKTPRISICTIGDLILDVVVLPSAPLASDADTPAEIRLTSGGQAANVAAWASALGAAGRLICARGTDATSQLATGELVRFGVEICGPVVAGCGGVVVSVRDAGGHRAMASDRGVGALLDSSALDPSWVRSCDVLHVSGYCLFREPLAEAAIVAAKLAPRVSLDLASARDIERVGAERFAARVAELEPELIFATEAERAVVPDFGADWVIKLGARGARFPQGLYHAPAVTPVDTTGAGDALAAGYLVGGPELAIEAAVRSVGIVGAMPEWPVTRGGFESPGAGLSAG